MLELARSIIFQTKCMENREIAAEIFKKRRATYVRIEKAEKYFAQMNTKTADPELLSIQKSMDEEKVSLYKAATQTLNLSLDNVSMIVKERLSWKERRYLVSHEPGSDPVVQKAVASAQEALSDYRESIRKVFTKKLLVKLSPENGSEKNQAAELFEYFAGPKEYLMIYYGFTIGEDRRHPFEAAGIKATYSLRNPTPQALEEEIRNDLKKTGQALPRPLLQNRPIESLAPSKVQQLRNKLLRCAVLDAIELKEAKEWLIELYGWDKETVQPSDIVFIGTREPQRLFIVLTQLEIKVELSLADPRMIHKAQEQNREAVCLMPSLDLLDNDSLQTYCMQKAREKSDTFS
jgi:hypothetical protein